MKYTEAWSSVVSQNFNLKIVTIVLGALSILLSMITLKMTFKDSVIVERGCFSRSLQPSKDEHTKQEIENFLREALSQRFDSLVMATDGLLSPDELKFRDQEQKEFSSRNMKQRLIVNFVTETTDGFKVDADRMISVAEVRSAFKFSLLVKLESKSRSVSNPYGLLVISAKQIDDKSKLAESK
jgi:hypothetical protein